MRFPFKLAVVLALTLTLLGAPTGATAQTPEEEAKAAQGLAWRLQTEFGWFHPEYERANQLLAEGKWEDAQTLFEAVSDCFIRPAVKEGWAGKEPISSIIYDEASVGVVVRGWSLEELKERLGRASNPEPQIVGVGGKSEWLEYSPKGLMDWTEGATYSYGRFLPVSRVVFHVDPRFIMKYQQHTFVWCAGYQRFFHHVPTTPTVIFWVPNTEGNPLWVGIEGLDEKGWFVEVKARYIGPIGPGSTMEVTLP